MIRLFAPFVNLFAAVILKILLQGDVSITLNAPAEVVAGTEFEVAVTIDKGDLASFSRLQQNLPAGLIAVSDITANADFSFKNKTARFIWLRMPDEKQFRVTYKVKVDQRLKGSFNIAGKFSYIEDNERRAVGVESEQITILPSPDIDPSLIVDIADYERLVIPYISPATSDPKIACLRQHPKPAKDGNGYIVNLLVSKERKEKFAKIEEAIPSGYRAEKVSEGDALFTFEDGTAKYLWLNLPATSFFMVSYRLIPENGGSQLPDLEGKFSYLEEDKTISIDIKQTGQNLAQINTPEELYNLIQEITSPQLAENKNTTTQQTDVSESGSTSPAVPEARSVKKQKNRRRYQLEAEEGIYYRVQLAAGHKPVNIRRYFRKYNLDKEVRKESHDGWLKYSIGSFPSYKTARDYRVHIWNTTVIDDAFVAAYNDGSRITVQEALMIANQKWYK